jgi:hypothetical protein
MLLIILIYPQLMSCFWKVSQFNSGRDIESAAEATVMVARESRTFAEFRTFVTPLQIVTTSKL